MATIDELRATFLFEAFSDDQLRWLIEHAEEVLLDAGERIVAEGQPTDALWVLLSGRLQISLTVAGRETVVNSADVPGTWVGWLPVFDDASPISCRLLEPSRLLRIAKEDVRHLLTAGFPVTTHLLAGITGGVRNFEATARQQEKLAALGKLSAGLAHELNNPAAAVRRAASRLRDGLRDRDEQALALGRRLEPDQVAALAELKRQAVERLATAPVAPLDPLARSDREDALAAWLDDRGVADGYDLAPSLIDAGLDIVDLERVAGDVAPEALPDALVWLGVSVATDALVVAVEQGAARISDLIGAIRDYSYMDQAPEQDVDLHRGIENTLTMLAHKLKGVTVTREYDPNLPRIWAFGSQLNQVWTNLIDNAVDAVSTLPAERRRIVVRTVREDGGVLVEVADNGPGVPPEIQGRIFEPFFTTKGAGLGTGLGLDITHRIVVRQHHGDIRVLSRPGDTRFQVRLPGGPPHAAGRDKTRGAAEGDGVPG